MHTYKFSKNYLRKSVLKLPLTPTPVFWEGAVLQKVNAVRTSELKVTADLAVIQKPHSGRYCTVLGQDGEAPVIIFEVKKEKIQSYDLCMHELFVVKRIGI